MKRTRRFSPQALIASGVALAFCAVIATPSSAALITWGTSQELFQGAGNETGAAAQAIVNTEGTFVLGINATEGSGDSVLGETETVNGVDFTNVSGATLFTAAGFTSNGVTTRVEATAQDPNQAIRSTPTAFGSGSITDPSLNDILEGGIFDEATLTFSGLTAGLDYELQIFTNDARGGNGAGGRDNLWQVGFSDGVDPIDLTAPAGVSILNNRDPDTLTGETSGNFIIGTFTADGTTQSFDFAGTRNAFTSIAGGQSQINALQLRDVTATAVPEPGSLAVLGLGSLVMFRRRRRSA